MHIAGISDMGTDAWEDCTGQPVWLQLGMESGQLLGCSARSAQGTASDDRSSKNQWPTWGRGTTKHEFLLNEEPPRVVDGVNLMAKFLLSLVLSERPVSQSMLPVCQGYGGRPQSRLPKPCEPTPIRSTGSPPPSPQPPDSGGLRNFEETR
jgi:hypothetical protein